MNTDTITNTDLIIDIIPLNSFALIKIDKK